MGWLLIYEIPHVLVKSAEPKLAVFNSIVSHSYLILLFISIGKINYFYFEISVTSALHQLRIETRPNTLYRLAASNTESFEQIYRIVIYLR